MSRVINNNYPVKKETKERVEAAIEKMNFVPNHMARSLITKKTYTLGVVVPGITNLFFSAIVENIEREIKKEGYSISLCNTGGDYKEEKKLVTNLLKRKVDGIIVIDPSQKNLKDRFYEEISKSTALIIISALNKDIKVNYVSYDEEIGIREALDYLYKLNHRNIAFIRGSQSASYDLREKIYKEFIKENQISYEKIITIENGNSINASFDVEMKLNEALKEKVRPSAIFASNDIMAVGAINCCNNLGLTVPEDLSVIGCDNTFIANITSPKLTSIDLGINSVSKVASKEILALMNQKEDIRKKMIINTHLVIRESCK
ncbi:LacI family DNA-binding transcriptional regulator [Haloimpatiens sp. FM7315]|uniref:LacI family DNA-binding transcriptional regulator n=1 Tax=Haloimpatiens sp. FM7315 TaxID=3298609 RepID=UPI0039779481